MSRSLLIRRTAKRHIAEAFHWYERQSPGLGADFLEALETVLEQIESTPLLCAKIHRDIRRALLRRFPYGVFYFIQDGRSVVVAVLHTSRDPKLWRAHH